MGSTASEDFALITGTKSHSRHQSGINGLTDKRASEHATRQIAAAFATAGVLEDSGVQYSAELAKGKAPPRSKGSKRKAGGEAAKCMDNNKQKVNKGKLFVQPHQVVSKTAQQPGSAAGAADVEGQAGKKKKKQDVEKLPEGAVAAEASNLQVHAQSGAQGEGCTGGLAAAGDELKRTEKQKKKSSKVKQADTKNSIGEDAHVPAQEKKKRKSMKTEEQDSHGSGVLSSTHSLNMAVGQLSCCS